MAKERLSAEQNIEMRGKNLEEKIALLVQWRNKGKITILQYNCLQNSYINKELKKELPEIELPRTGSSTGPAMVVESEINVFIDKLKSNINNYLTIREKDCAKLSVDQISNYSRYVNNYFWLPQIDELLIIGLRYPDKRVSEISERYIREYKVRVSDVDKDFWLKLWSDKNLVPLNAVRIMLDENGCLHPGFRPQFVKQLIPFIEWQRKKEEIRLQFTKFESSALARQREHNRKQRRLDAFSRLLEVVQKS